MRYPRTADQFFSDTEKERLKTTISDVESWTIGEVVVMVIDQSDLYIEAPIIGAILLTSLISLIIAFLSYESSLIGFLVMNLLFFFPLYQLFRRVALLKIPFLGARRKEHAVEQRAVRAFYDHGLYKTRENTGVLFFLSLLERKVWVLADKGIYQKMGQESLNQFAQTVSKGIRDGHACDALCEAIRGMGQLLSRHFPMKAGDIDELPDTVIIEKSETGDP